MRTWLCLADRAQPSRSVRRRQGLREVCNMPVPAEAPANDACIIHVHVITAQHDRPRHLGTAHSQVHSRGGQAWQEPVDAQTAQRRTMTSSGTGESHTAGLQWRTEASRWVRVTINRQSKGGTFQYLFVPEEPAFSQVPHMYPPTIAAQRRRSTANGLSPSP